eukprot:1149664-Pelagomonas_calceolata.AAC.4
MDAMQVAMQAKAIKPRPSGFAWGSSKKSFRLAGASRAFKKKECKVCVNRREATLLCKGIPRGL